MKLKHLFVACSLALVGTQAHAINPFGVGGISQPNIPDITVPFSGASGQRKAFATVAEGLCASDIDTFKDNANGKKYYAVYCIADTVKTGLAANTAMLIQKRNANGSVAGVLPVARGFAILSMDIQGTDAGNPTCTEDAPGSNTWTCDISKAGGMKTSIPVAGVSDVGPSTFVTDEVPDPTSLDPRDTNAGQDWGVINSADAFRTMQTTGGLGFAPFVSLNLYKALQKVESAGGKLPANCNPNGAAYTNIVSNPTGTDLNVIRGDAPECMPSLSKSQFASMLIGKVKKWNDFRDSAGTGLVDHFVALGGTAPTSPNFKLCRRLEGSGTKAAIDLTVLNYPTNPKAVKQVDRSGVFGSGPDVVISGSSGGVTACVVAADTGNAAWAVGYQSNEKIDPQARYLKLDGIEPGNHQIFLGKYNFWVESTCQVRNDLVAGVIDVNKVRVADILCSNIGNPTTSGKVVQPYGDGGILGTPPGNCPAVGVNTYNPADPRTPYGHGEATAPDNGTTPTYNTNCLAKIPGLE